jgi:uncharacterized repeat protein (TIGR03943 family)
MPPQYRRRTVSWREIVDILVLFIWGMMLLRFWFTGSINVLLHPDYMWLSNGAAIVLLGLGTLKLVQLLRGKGTADNNLPHFSLFPPAVSSAILLGVAVFGLIFTPRPFASETALARGVSDTVTATRSQPQQFGNFTRPEDRSLVGWIRTLNVYPEPDAYDGQAVNVDGFVVHTPDLPENYFTLTRFIITCCAADAYPVGLPVLLEQSRDTYAPDTWLQVQGNMKSETLNGERRLVIQAERLEQIPEPKNPYDY